MTSAEQLEKAIDIIKKEALALRLIDPFQKFLYEDMKWRAQKELMNLTPDQVLLLGRR